eukprot:COSAG05_NODE_2817_length_2609_cov_2.411952_3_plen_58_part_00
MSRECKSGEITAFLIGRLTVNPGPAGTRRVYYYWYRTTLTHRVLVLCMRMQLLATAA